MYISFIHPAYLVFLFAIPVLIFFHFFGLKNLKGRSLKFANFEAIARVKGIDLYSKSVGLLVFNILFVILLVLALSGATLHTELSASSFSFVIAVDASGSMEATDLEPNRLGAAKETAKDFVDNLPSDSYVGVISFTGDSNVEQGLTKNKFDIKNAIENIELGWVGGTDAGEAIGASVKLLKDEQRKAVILLSDGQINVGELADIINDANLANIVIHSFGIGTVEGGEASYGMSTLDEDNLKSLAYNTGGEYFNVKTKQEMQDSFNTIVEVTEREGVIDLTLYLIILAIILFILEQLLISMNKIGF